MKLDIDFNSDQQMSLVTFNLDQFQSQRDFAVAISIISTFSADFNLDPELEQEDLEDIIAKAKEKQQETFTFEISEEGIEVSF